MKSPPPYERCGGMAHCKFVNVCRTGFLMLLVNQSLPIVNHLSSIVALTNLLRVSWIRIDSYGLHRNGRILGEVSCSILSFFPLKKIAKKLTPGAKG